MNERQLFSRLKHHVQVVEDWVGYPHILNYSYLRNEGLNVGNVGVDLTLKSAQNSLPFLAALERTIKIKHYLILDTPHFISFLEELAAFGLPLLVLFLGLVFFLDEGEDPGVDGLEVFHYILISFFLRQLYILTYLTKFFFDLEYQPILLLPYLLGDPLLELSTVHSKVQTRLLSLESLKKFIPFIHFTVSLGNCLEFVIFMSSKECTMST